MRVAVLGAGAVGARIARQLLSGTKVTQIVLRDTDADRLAQVSKSLGERVIIEHSPFNSKIDAEVIVVATPSGTQMPSVIEAIETKRPVISTSDSLAETVALLKFANQAKENNIPIVRATNDGISALIDQKGTIVDYMGKGNSGILHVKLVPTDVRTFYNKHGNLLLYICLFIVSIKVFFVRMRNA